MSWIDRVFKKKGLNPQELRQAPVTFGQYIFPEWKSNVAIDGFLNNADVYAIITLVARKASSIPWYVFRKKTEKGAALALERYKMSSRNGNILLSEKFRKKAYDDQEIVDDGYISKLLTRPNPNQGQDQFFENAIGYRLLCGESDIWLNRGAAGLRVEEMYILPTQFVEISPDKNDLYGISSYRLNVSGNPINLNKEDVIQWKSWNPEFDEINRTHLRGLSPLKAAYKTLLMSNEANRAGVAMYANGGAKGALIPGVVGSMMPNPTPEQATRIKEAINQTINNADSRGAVSVLQTRWDYLNFGLSATDMDLLNSMKLTREQLCQVFGVPAVLFSTDSMADNNYQNALRDLVTNTVVPLLSTLRDEMNRVLVGDQDVFIDFDINALPELQRDLEKQVNALKSADWLTYDEKRIATGYEPKGDFYDMAYVSSGVVPIDQVGIDLNDDTMLDN